MKKLFLLSAAFFFLAFLGCSEDAYDNIRKYVTAEVIYSEKFDTISAAIGFERVEIYLTQAGRSDSLKYTPVKAQKTIVEYDGQTVEYDGMRTWLSVVNLDKAKLYRFKVYTIDHAGNQSVPLEISKIPFTKEDRDAIRVSDPKTILSPWGVSLSWPSLISTSMWNFTECEYSFRDKDGQTVNGTMDAEMEAANNLRFDATNLSPGSIVEVGFNINVVPLIDDEQILDTVTFSQKIELQVPTTDEYGQYLTSREIASWSNDGVQMTINWKPVSDYTMTATTLTYKDYSDPSNPVERVLTIDNATLETPLPGLIYQRFEVYSAYEPLGGGGTIVESKITSILPEFADKSAMAANGIDRNTDPLSITKLNFPVHVGNLLDVLYFPNLKEIDLTGGGAPIPTYLSTGNNVSSELGGCPWNFGFRRIDYANSSYREFKGAEALRRVLQRGQITKLKYAAGTMGLDEILLPYASITETLTSPDEILLTNKVFADGAIVSTNWNCSYTYMPGDQPAGIPGGSATHVWKIIPKTISSSFCFVYPPEYKFNIWEYRYLKMKVFSPDASYFPDDYYKNWQRIWFRIRNHLWGHTPTPYWDNNGDEKNADREKYRLQATDLGRWKEVTFDTRDVVNGTDAHPYYNVLVINLGGEPGGTFAPAREMVYYFADVRWSKNP
ncbi:MAG: hypothetical protein LBS80_05600 [Tannerella sp.]|jgi:hypothetical protein|nr:hypothetical protein [Tannerella sp.]